jgi:hypothetical protein
MNGIRARALACGLVSAVGCKSGDTPSGTAGARPAGSAAAAPVIPDVQARQAWRLALTAGAGGEVRPRAARILPGGELLFAWEYAGALAIPGREGRVPTATGTDLVVTRVSATGAIASAHAISGSGDQEIAGLAATTGGADAVLAVQTDETIAIAGTRVAVPARDELPLPTASALVSVGADGAPIRAIAGPVDARRLAVLALDDGELVIATSYTGEDELFGRAVIERRRADATVAWTTSLPGVEVNALTAVGARIGVAQRADRGLRFVLLDASTGRALGPGVAVTRQPGGDLGQIAGAVVHGDDLVLYGETGREPAGARSHSIEPFVIRASGDAARHEQRQLADATGAIAGVGTVHGHPAAVVIVIHNDVLYGGTGLPHRGVYVALGGATGPPRFAPIFQVRFEGNDWERGEREVVFGEEIAVRTAVFGADAVYLLGTCGARTGCIDRIEIARR